MIAVLAPMDQNKNQSKRKPLLSMGTPSIPWDLLRSRQNGYLGFRPV
jgi:hypothetical protein